MVKKISFFIGIRGASRLKIYSDLQLSFWDGNSTKRE